MAETLPGAMAQPFSNPLSQFTENVGAGVKAELDIERQVAEAKKKELAPLIAEDRAKRDEFAGRQKEVTQQMTKPFEVPQPMMADFASLGGMLAVTASMLGGAGKQPAMQAMAAMTGVLDGFQKGRKDLVDRSFKEFDANMKRLQALQKAIDVELSAWAEKAKLGREDANLNLEVAAALVKNGSAEGLIRGKTADSIFKYMQFKESLSAAQTRAQQQIDARRDEFDRSNIIVNSQTGEQGYVSSRDGKFHKLDVPQGYITQKEFEARQKKSTEDFKFVDQNGKPIRLDDKGNPPPGTTKIFKVPTFKEGGGSAGAAAGQIERINNAISQVSGAIKNVADLPVITTTPLYGQKFFNSIFLAPLSVLNQTMDDSTTQMMQTRLVGVARNLATLETGGAATGLVGLQQSIQDGIAIPKGAKLYVALDKIGEMRRIVDDAARTALASNKYTPEQKALIKENLEIVHKSIPFTQDDVTAAVKKGLDPKLTDSQKKLTFTEFANVKFPQSGAASAGGGASSTPQLPKGATQNLDGTFDFPGNNKIPKGTYKFKADGSIERVR